MLNLCSFIKVQILGIVLGNMSTALIFMFQERYQMFDGCQGKEEHLFHYKAIPEGEASIGGSVCCLLLSVVVIV